MPRLRPATLVLTSGPEGRRVRPPAGHPALAGYRYGALRPPTPGLRTVPRATTAPGSAGLLDLEAAAELLDLPLPVLHRWAATAPHRLPRHRLIDGRPYFRPDDLTEFEK